MFTKIVWVAGLFLDVYKDVPGCWVVSICLQRCSGLLGCFYLCTKMFWVAGLFLDVYKDVLGCWVVSICLQRCSGLLGCF